MKHVKAMLTIGVAGLLLCTGCTQLEQDGDFFAEQGGMISKCLSEETMEWNISYGYPYLVQTEDHAELINTLVQSFAEESVHEFQDERADMIREDWEEWLEDSRSEEFSLYSFQMEYTVQRSDESYFSVTFDGYTNAMPAAHPTNCFQSLTIDLKTEEAVTLLDLYTVNDEFVEIIREHLEEQSGERFGSDESVAEEVVMALSPEELYADEYPIFLTETELGVSIDCHHALGDHFEVTIPYEELEAFRR